MGVGRSNDEEIVGTRLAPWTAIALKLRIEHLQELRVDPDGPTVGHRSAVWVRSFLAMCSRISAPTNSSRCGGYWSRSVTMPCGISF